MAEGFQKLFDPEIFDASMDDYLSYPELATKQIERAAALMPRDPATALEAGTIAILSGREDGARKSWQSAIDLAPQSEEAETARTYLAQLAPASDISTQDTP